MTSIYMDDPLAIVVTYTLATIAIYKASQRGLTKHIKRHELKDPNQEAAEEREDEKHEVKEEDPSDAEAQSQDSATKPRSKWSKWLDTLMLLGILVVLGGISVALGLGLPKIATSQIQDMIWMVMVGFQVWLNYKGFIDDLLPDPRSFESRWVGWNTINWTDTNTALVGPAPSPYSYKRRRLTTILTLATLAGVYAEHQWIISFPISIWVYRNVTSTMIPNRPVRSILRRMTVMQIVTVGIVSLCFGAFQVYRLYWPKEDTDVGSPKELSPQPSQQVLQLMMMMGSSIPLIVSGFFIALGLRFDYTQALKRDLIQSPPPTEAKFIKLPPFPKPLFTAGLQTSMMVLVAMAMMQSCSSSSDMRDRVLGLHAICLPASIVALRMIIVAKQEGVYEEFMEYTELGQKALEEKRADEVTEQEERSSPRIHDGSAVKGCKGSLSMDGGERM